MGLKLLLTGGTGYIGSHAAVHFLNEGHEVFLFDNLSNSNKSTLKNLFKITGSEFPFIKGDIRDTDLVNGTLKSNAIEGVIHFAGLKSVADSVQDPLVYFDNNVNGSLSLLKAMQASKVNFLVFSSSATVYGQPERLPMDESHSLFPTNPYGKTKLQVEEILSNACSANKSLRCISLRYFNPAGAHESGMLGEQPKGVPNNIFPYISQVALGKRKCLNIFGNDYDTPDGTGIRDYIHITDLIEGHIAALNYLLTIDSINRLKSLKKDENYFVSNLGSGRGYSVLEVVEEFQKGCIKDIPINITSRRKGDVPESYADASFASKLLKWKTKKSLKDICKSIHNFQNISSP